MILLLYVCSFYILSEIYAFDRNRLCCGPGDTYIFRYKHLYTTAMCTMFISRMTSFNFAVFVSTLPFQLLLFVGTSCLFVVMFFASPSVDKNSLEYHIYALLSIWSIKLVEINLSCEKCEDCDASGFAQSLLRWFMNTWQHSHTQTLVRWWTILPG